MINNREIYQMQKDIEALKLKEPDFSITTGVKFNLTPSLFTLDETLGRYKANLNHNLNKDVEGFSISFYTEDKESVFFDYKIIDTNNIEIHSDEPVDIIVSIKQGVECKAHNHDLDYSKINHNHDSDYSSTNHDHDEVYSKLDHTHESTGGDNKIKTLEEFKAAVASKNKIIELESGIEIVLDETVVIDFELTLKGEKSTINTSTLEIGVFVGATEYTEIHFEGIYFKSDMSTNNGITASFDNASKNPYVVNSNYYFCGLSVVGLQCFTMKKCKFSSNTGNSNKVSFLIDAGSFDIGDNIFGRATKIVLANTNDLNEYRSLIIRNNIFQSSTTILVLGKNVLLEGNDINQNTIVIGNNTMNLKFNHNSMRVSYVNINHFVRQRNIYEPPSDFYATASGITFENNILDFASFFVNGYNGIPFPTPLCDITFLNNTANSIETIVSIEKTSFIPNKFMDLIENTYTYGSIRVNAFCNNRILFSLNSPDLIYKIECDKGTSKGTFISSRLSYFPKGKVTVEQNTLLRSTL